MQFIDNIRAYVTELLQWRLIFYTVIINICCLQYGYAYGYSSPVLQELRNKANLTEFQVAIFVSILFFGAIFGSILGMLLIQRLGRQAFIIFIAAFSNAGWLLILLADGDDFSWIVFLSCGRFLTGVGIGGFMSANSVYVSEFVPNEIRGVYLSSVTFTNVIGIFMPYILGNFLNFRWLTILPILLTLTQVVLLFFVPYSPAWLISRGLERRAYVVLKNIRPNSHREAVYEEINQSKNILQQRNSNSLISSFKSLFKKHHLRAYTIGMIFFISSRICGNSIILTYSSDILKSTNFSSLVVPMCYTVGIVLNFVFVDKLGRKPLILFSFLVLALSFLSLAVFLHVSYAVCHDENCSKFIQLVPLLIIGVFCIAYAFGVGPGVWNYLGEFFPIRIKTFSSSSGILLLSLTTFAITFLFPIITQLVGLLIVYWGLAIINICSLLFAFVFLPETKNKSVDEIEDLFKDRLCQCLDSFETYSYKVV